LYHGSTHLLPAHNHCRWPGLISIPRYNQLRYFSQMEAARPPRFLDNPLPHLPCSPTPAGLFSQTSFYKEEYCPHDNDYEGSGVIPPFEAQSHGFCGRCLRFVTSVTLHAQDSLPVAGQALPSGIRTHWVIKKISKIINLIPIHQPLPGATKSVV